MLLVRWDYLECEGIRLFDHSQMTYDDWAAGKWGRQNTENIRQQNFKDKPGVFEGVVAVDVC